MAEKTCSNCRHWSPWEYVPPTSVRYGWGRCMRVGDRDAPMHASGDDGADFETSPAFSCSEYSVEVVP